MFVGGAILSGLVGAAVAAAAQPSGSSKWEAPSGPRCGGPAEAPGFEVPARRGVVPDVVCMDLQLAQDKAQAAGVSMAARDARGGRLQVSDRDWVVVSQTPPAGRPAGRLTIRVLAYGDPGAPPAPDRAAPGRLPRLACFELQEAQDTLQSAGFTAAIASRDATGRARRQFADRAWTVTGQAPPPGGTWRKTTRVTLEAVRDDEASTCH
jgi:hypothetical protein